MKTLLSGGFAALFLCTALQGAAPAVAVEEEAVAPIAAAGQPAAASIDAAMKRAALDYGRRLRAANEELTKARARIAQEKAPLLKAMRAAEDRLIAAETEITRLETGQEQFSEIRRKLGKEADALRKNESYLATLAHDSLGTYVDGLLPGERQFLPAKIQALQEGASGAAQAVGGRQAPEVAEALFAQVQQALGGHMIAGTALIDGSSEVVKGTYAFVGPEVFFRAEKDGAVGTVRVRDDGTGHPVTYLLRDWKPAGAEAFFQGKMGAMLADASAGKALRLKETKGTVWQHIHKGGVVSYGILCVGLLSAIMIVLKIRDLATMAVDTPEVTQRCLDTVVSGPRQAAEQSVQGLKVSTRELFTVGLRYINLPKDLLEEHLSAVLLRQRLHYERRLPLLAVIATAAPLMGLLGTVTGMVRTFALITVFGTGNAGKLASGISEVLVATELGLLVAIPTLVAHGFLSHRIQKNLSLLERYALEFVTAAQEEEATEQKSRKAISA